MLKTRISGTVDEHSISAVNLDDGTVLPPFEIVGKEFSLNLPTIGTWNVTGREQNINSMF